MSWDSRDVSLRPEASLNLATTYLNNSTRGSGPLARPPKVLSRVPAGLTADTSHLGTSPAHRRARTCRRAFAHPSLESLT